MGKGEKEASGVCERHWLSESHSGDAGCGADEIFSIFIRKETEITSRAIEKGNCYTPYASKGAVNYCNTLELYLLGKGKDSSQCFSLKWTWRKNMLDFNPTYMGQTYTMIKKVPFLWAPFRKTNLRLLVCNRCNDEMRYRRMMEIALCLEKAYLVQNSSWINCAYLQKRCLKSKR